MKTILTKVKNTKSKENPAAFYGISGYKNQIKNAMKNGTVRIITNSISASPKTWSIKVPVAPSAKTNGSIHAATIKRTATHNVMNNRK